MELYTILGFTALMLFFSAVRFVKEHDRLVIFRFGRLAGLRGPGPCVVWPFIEHPVKVDLRATTMRIEAQDVLSHDNVGARLSFVCMYQISDPLKLVTRVVDPHAATKELALAAAKTIVSQHDAEYWRKERHSLHSKLKHYIHKQTVSWGIKVTSLEVGDFDFSQTANDLPEILETLAEFLCDEGRFEQAHKLLKRSVELTTSSHRIATPALARSMKRYATVLRLANRDGEADQVEVKLLELSEKR